MPHIHKHLRYIQAHYIRSKIAFIFAILFFIIGILFTTTNLAIGFIYQVLLPTTNTPMIVKITDTVPENTERIYIDCNQLDFDPVEFTLKDARGDNIAFNKTAFGTSAILNKQEFTSNLDLKFSTYTEGDVDILITYADSELRPISAHTQTEHFEHNALLVTLFAGLLFLIALTLFIIAVNWRLFFGAIKRILGRGSSRHR